jgi:acetyl-CoA C-acetyltransferase
MREVVIIGIGQTPVSEEWDKSLREIAGDALLAALLDAHIQTVEGIYIGNMLSGLVSKQENLGAMVADWVGIKHIEAFKTEAACGSGGAALRMAIMAVGSGEIDSAIALGVEKMTETKGSETTAALATAADADYEIINGLSFVAINALIMQRYMHEYHWQHKDFAPFSINAHANALENPFARLHERISEKDYSKARMISDPINLMDASPIGDGAAAAVIVPLNQIKTTNWGISKKDSLGRPVVKIAASCAVTDTIAVHNRKDPLWLAAAERSAKQAYSQAGITPQDIDVFELHDAFSIMTALSLEACGFADRGQGPKLGLEGEVSIGGNIPISTRGGLKARGHPVGATGMYQVVEVVQQLREEAGASQVADAKIGMAQNIGGSGASIITHILKTV